MATPQEKIAPPFETTIDFKNPIWNRDTWARIQGDLNPENERVGYAAGDVLGVVPGQAVKPLCGFETFLATRLMSTSCWTRSKNFERSMSTQKR